MKKSILILMIIVFLPCLTWSQNTITVSTTTKNQTMEGFGAAIAYFENWLTAHPNKAEIYKLIFGDLNLDILRLRNVYGYPSNTLDDPKEIVQQAAQSLGHPIDILLSSWSPPAGLKQDSITDGGTLLKVNGQFVYDDFAQWWYDAIQAYEAAGITPTYISLQNEPDYENTGWETCIFKSTESSSYPGYNVALETLYNKLQGMANRPLILGPEVTGVGFNNFQNYVDSLNTSYLDAYAYHLYNGGDASNPDSYNTNLTPIKDNYGDKPNIMTEYSGGTWFSTAWLIQNCLMNANASGYLYWNLIWGRPYDTGGLVSLEDPWDTTSWTTPKGYVINGDYYAVKHFSKYISKGYVRIGASSPNSNLRTTAFLSPDGTKLVAVILNVGSGAETANIAFAGFTASSVIGYQSVTDNYYQSLGAVTPSSSLSLPSQSVTTLDFTKTTEANPVTGVSVSPSEITINGDTTATLTAVVIPSNATNQDVVWSSDNEGIVTVSSTGVLQPVADGTANVTVTTQDGGYTATCAVTITGTGVSPAPCSSPVAISLPFTQDGAGEDCYVTSGDIVSVNSWNMQSLEINGVDYTDLWSTSMPPRINGNYYIHYVANVGWAHLEIDGTNGSSGSVAVTGVTVAPSSVSLNVGSTTDLTATVSPNNATDPSVSWSTSDANVAMVNSSGVVTGVATGTATITVTTTDGGYTASSNITVTSTNIPVTGVSVAPTNASISVGSTASLSATVSPNDATDPGINWSTSNANVATVSSGGVVTGVAAGTATITVTTTDGGYTALSVITVNSTNVPVTGVSIVPTSASVNEGSTISLIATVSPGNATDPSVSWSTSDPAIATVSSNGVVTGVSAGSVTITVTTTDGGYTASSAVTVTTVATTPCDNPVTISIPFTQDGAGEYCWVTSQQIAYVNSWNLDTLEINGVDYTNVWSNTLPAPINGNYYIHYVGSFSWSHFEAPATKDAKSDIAATPNNVTIYPVPAKDKIHLISRSKMIQVDLVTINGETVFHNTANTNTFTFNVEGLPKGIYVIKIRTKENWFVSKIAIE